MFGGGYLTPLLPLLFEHGAMSSLMSFAPNEPTPLMMVVAQNTDRRIAADKSVNPAFFMQRCCGKIICINWRNIKAWLTVS